MAAIISFAFLSLTAKAECKTFWTRTTWDGTVTDALVSGDGSFGGRATVEHSVPCNCELREIQAHDS